MVIPIFSNYFLFSNFLYLACNILFQTDQLVYILTDLFDGGTQTVSTTFRWCIMYLAKYKEVQNNLYEEINNVIGIT